MSRTSHLGRQDQVQFEFVSSQAHSPYGIAVELDPPDDNWCMRIYDPLCLYAGLPVAKVKQFMQLSNPIKSLDVPLWQDGDDTHNCVVADQGTSASEDEAVRVQSQDMVEKDMTALLQTLPVRERNVIRWFALPMSPLPLADAPFLLPADCKA